MDWVTDNIYIASFRGFILACDGRPAASFTCTTVVTGHGWAAGIALDRVAGLAFLAVSLLSCAWLTKFYISSGRTMYFTKSYDGSTGSIMRSELDGRNPVTLVTGLKEAHGIAIDFSSRRLYWTDVRANRIHLMYRFEYQATPWGSLWGKTEYTGVQCYQDKYKVGARWVGRSSPTKLGRAISTNYPSCQGLVSPEIGRTTT